MTSMMVVFYCSPAGNESARDWLRDLVADQRRIIGEDLKVVQQRWPLGMPLVRKMGKDLWELHSSFPDGIALVLYRLPRAGHRAAWIHQEERQDTRS